ncbi:hypothetical protein RGQ29_018299 [Quercus rubra]|uniref:Trichome birefringence-like C-terminal domain-containing protein n=1 Tax=Quercus rubra TaxID=3512 RepID=A0AAN7FIX9_QUERU|nr:hypothetical protein RGQ29_018299 [Quercus rubra]
MDSISERIIMPESISKHGVHWEGVDYLIFNTYIWWMKSSKMKVLRGSFDEATIEYDEIQWHIAYERVLRTWAKWVEKNVDPKSTFVFFRSMSPTHIKSLDWNNPNGIKCANETTPYLNMSTPLYVGTDHQLFLVESNVTQSMKVSLPPQHNHPLRVPKRCAHLNLHHSRRPISNTRADVRPG